MSSNVAELRYDMEIKFFHAINYRDFIEYLCSDAILARSELAGATQDFTQFFTDSRDKELGVWNRVFGNLNDLGRYFWSFERAVPNAYGPITIVLAKDCWDHLNDIKLTRRTITSSNPEKIPPEKVDEIFEKANGTYRLKKGYAGVEVSTANSCISLDFLAYILVDPIVVNGRTLREWILDSLPRGWASVGRITNNRVIERTIYKSSQTERINDLIKWSRDLRGRLIHNNEPLEYSVPNRLEGWFFDLEDWQRRVLASWLTYFYNGTLQWLENGG